MKKNQYNTLNDCFAAVLTATMVSFATADTIRVPEDAPTIQEAIERAQENDIILVSPGRYNEAINFLGKAITLKSSDGAAVTIIDGWKKNDSVVKCISGEGPSTVLDGFTITGGTGNTDLFSEDETVGGGMLCLNSSPTVLNCDFFRNSATYQGGAIYNGDRSNTVIQNCKIRSNISERGGGIYNSRGTPEILNTRISDNMAKFGGGGMYNFGTHVTIDSCLFKHNRAEYNGGGMYDHDSSGSIVSTTFTDNLAMFNGNAIYRGYRSAIKIADDCQFTMMHDTVSGTGGSVVSRGKIAGACCIGTGCLIVDDQSCVNAGGTWLGPSTTCEDQLVNCPKANSGDINADGVVDMMDLVLVMTSMQK